MIEVKLVILLFIYIYQLFTCFKFYLNIIDIHLFDFEIKT